MRTTRYAIGLGSNRRHPRHGPPAAVLRAALSAMPEAGLTVEARSPTIASAPLGPAQRRFANAAAIIRTTLPPRALLRLLKRIERDFGRRPGQRWGDRVLDLDILLWSGGALESRTLVIPHPALLQRRFALAPLAVVVPQWRIPRSPRHVVGALALLNKHPLRSARRPIVG